MKLLVSGDSLVSSALVSQISKDQQNKGGEAAAIVAAERCADRPEPAEANAKQTSTEKESYALAAQQTEEEQIRRRVEELVEEEKVEVARLEGLVAAMKKELEQERGKAVKFEEEVGVLKRALGEERGKAVMLEGEMRALKEQLDGERSKASRLEEESLVLKDTLNKGQGEKEVAAMKKELEEERSNAAKMKEGVATLMKAVQFANDGLEEIKRSAVEEGKKGPEEMGVVTLRKAVGEEKGKGVGLEAEVATLKKALEEANAMVEQVRAGGEGEVVALRKAVEEEKGKAIKLEAEMAALIKALTEERAENKRRDTEERKAASAAIVRSISEERDGENDMQATTKPQAAGDEDQERAGQDADEKDLSLRYPFQVRHNGALVRATLCRPGAALWCDRAQYKLQGLPASLDHALLFQLPCRLFAPLSFTLGSPAEVVLFFVAAPRDGELPHKLVSEGWVLQSVFSRFDWDGPGADKEHDRFVTTVSKTYDGPVNYTLPAHTGETVMGFAIRPLDVNHASEASVKELEKLSQTTTSQSVEHPHGQTEEGRRINDCVVRAAVVTMEGIEERERERAWADGQASSEDAPVLAERAQGANQVVDGGADTKTVAISVSKQFEHCLAMAVEVEVLAELESLRAENENLKSAENAAADLEASLAAMKTENARLRQELDHLREAASFREKEHKAALKSIRYGVARIH